MWQKPSLTKSMMSELSNSQQTPSSPSSPKLPFSPSSQSFANRALPNRISQFSTSTSSLPPISGGGGPSGSGSSVTGYSSGGKPIPHGISAGGSSSLPNSPVSSPVNPFNPMGGGAGKNGNNRRRGVTVAGGSEQVETRRKILLGNSRPMIRRSNSVEVLNSWDFVPFQKKPTQEEQESQVDQYIQGDKENDDENISYESLISNRESIVIEGGIGNSRSSSFTTAMDQTKQQSSAPSSPSSNSIPPLSIPQLLQKQNSFGKKVDASTTPPPTQQHTSSSGSSTNTSPTTSSPITSSPLPSPRKTLNSSGNVSPPVPPRSSRSLGLSNDFSISLSTSTSSSSLLAVSGSINSTTPPLPLSISASSSLSASTSSSLLSSTQSVSKLNYEKNEENKFVVVSGPKDQLVEYLCNKNKMDFSFVNSFILSFRYFIEPEELFNHLMIKYDTKVQTTSSIKVSKQFEEIQERIKQNILIIISVWIDCNFSDFEDNLNLHKRLLKLVSDSPHAVFLKDSIDRQRVSKIPILDLYEKLKDELLLSLSPRGSSSSYSLNNSVNNSSSSGSSIGGSFSSGSSVTSSSDNIKNIKNSFFSLSTMMEWLMSHLSIGYATADSILKKLFKLKVIGSLGGGGFTNISSSQTNSNNKSSKEELYFFVNTTLKSTIVKEIYSRSFMDYSPQDIAKQLTLMEFKLFQDVKLKELYHKSWTISKSKFENSPTIMAIITMSNKIANWVATEVVTTPHPKKRVEVLKRFISVAEHCKKINNFNTLMEVISGLSNSAVSRLKETWKSLPTRYLNSFNSIQNFLKTDENWKQYRTTLKTRETPCLPYLGLFLQDINFIEDGNSNYLENDFVNFKKMNILTSVFTEIQYFQRHPYFSFSTQSNIMTFFDKDIVILPEKELYQFSKFVESPGNPLNKLSKFMKSSIN